MSFELTYLNFIQENLRSPFMDQFMVFITKFGEYGLFWILLSVGLLIKKSTRKWGLILCTALVIDIVLLNGIVKPLVARTRPCYINTAIELLVKAPSGHSFPSGHAGACFTAAFALLIGKNKYWAPAMILAVLVGFSRNYLYVHWPTDVLGGLVIGMIAGFMGNFMYINHLIPKFITNTLEKVIG